MSYRQPPYVVKSFPGRGATNIPVHIRDYFVEFNIHLDENSIQGNIYLQESEGGRVPSLISYDSQNKRVNFKVEGELKHGTTYQFVLIGDHDISDPYDTGIKSIFGTPLEFGDTLEFTIEEVVLPGPPSLLSPSHLSMIKERPAFEWSVDAPTSEIQVSKSPEFSSMLWENKGVMTGVSIPESIELEEGLYHWRVRGLSKEGIGGPWSSVGIFALKVEERGTVSPGDTLPPEISYEPAEDGYVEIYEGFPKNGYSNVSTNLKTISFQVVGSVKPEGIDLELFGESVMGDEEDHGQIHPDIQVIPGEGYSTVLITLPVDE